MFAIVDIETTGGHNGANNITEIAIVLHNGKQIEGKYSTLINPQMPIQKFVQGLTGITDAMVAKAPTFNAVAANIYNLLHDKIFVAHNVNFDYSFVKNELQLAGFNLQTQKLCTIRLAKKAFPNLPKYGLGTICRELQIEVNNRHRAAGDAMATAILFDKILQSNERKEVDKLIKKKLHSYLPPNLNEAEVENLPKLPGVYYFKNKQQKIVYIGKAKNLYKRVVSHFSNNKTSAQKQGFLKDVYAVEFIECSSEFIASIVESIEIKKYWPLYNKSQKHYEHKFGIYTFEDNSGYTRLAIDKQKKTLLPLLQFSSITQAQNKLKIWIQEYQLHPELCFIAKKSNLPIPSKEQHNSTLLAIYEEIKQFKKSYIIQDKNSSLLVKNGIFYGICFESILNINNASLNEIEEHFEPKSTNSLVQTLIEKHCFKFPQKVVWFS